MKDSLPLSIYRNFKVYFWEYLILTFYLAKGYCRILYGIKWMFLLVHLPLLEWSTYDFLKVILLGLFISLTHHKRALWWWSSQRLIFVCFLSLQGRISILPTAQLLQPELNWQQNAAVSSLLLGSIILATKYL